jgi:hypothetical protein
MRMNMNWTPKMTEIHSARVAAHRNNLMRYRGTLATPLTNAERAYVRRRMDEERAQLKRLESGTRGERMGLSAA